jgi:hypothetical protein
MNLIHYFSEDFDNEASKVAIDDIFDDAADKFFDHAYNSIWDS